MKVLVPKAGYCGTIPMSFIIVVCPLNQLYTGKSLIKVHDMRLYICTVLVLLLP